MNTLCLLSIPLLIWMTLKKKKSIMNPINNDSYSVITLQILDCTILTLITQSIINIVFVICFFTDVSQSLPFLKFLKFLIVINVQNWDFINLFQVYEWYTMHSIVSYQKDKSFGEILFEIQNADIFKQFISKEKLRKRCFYAFGAFMYTLTIL